MDLNKFKHWLNAVLVLCCAVTIAQESRDSAPQDSCPTVVKNETLGPQSPPKAEVVELGPLPSDLEKDYRLAWTRIRYRYYQVETLKDWSVWEHKYDGKLKTQAQLDAAIKEMAESLGDRWTKYVSPGELLSDEHEESLGVRRAGLDFKRGADGMYRIESIDYGSPAHKSVLRLGDVVKSINGTELKYLRPDEADAFTCGLDGQVLKVVYLDGGKERSVDLKLAATPRQSLEVRLLAGNVVYIRLPGIRMNMEAQLRVAVKFVMKAAKGELKGLVLDLRGNGGGRVQASIDLAGLFLEKGDVLKMTSRIDRQCTEEVLRIAPAPAFAMEKMSAEDLDFVDFMQKKPMVILTDRSTASAAESLTGCLMDNGRARVVGTATFGKNVHYTRFELACGGIVQVTTGTLFTPSGFDVSRGGIKPHVEVEQTRDNSDKQLKKGLDVLKKLIK